MVHNDIIVNAFVVLYHRASRSSDPLKLYSASVPIAKRYLTDITPQNYNSWDQKRYEQNARHLVYVDLGWQLLAFNETIVPFSILFYLRMCRHLRLGVRRICADEADACSTE
jgi:hypothetical protein